MMDTSRRGPIEYRLWLGWNADQLNLVEGLLEQERHYVEPSSDPDDPEVQARVAARQALAVSAIVRLAEARKHQIGH